MSCYNVYKKRKETVITKQEHKKQKSLTSTGDATVAAFLLLCGAIMTHITGIKIFDIINITGPFADNGYNLIVRYMPIVTCLIGIIFIIHGLAHHVKIKEKGGYLWFPIIVCIIITDILLIWCIHHNIPIIQFIQKGA